MSFLRLGAALRGNGFHLLKRIHNTALLYFSSGFSHSVVKSRYGVRCGRPDPWACDIDERVIVAVGQNPADKDKIARGLALVPQLLARAREKPCRAGVHRQLQGLLVRVAEHQTSPFRSSWQIIGTRGAFLKNLDNSIVFTF